MPKFCPNCGEEISEKAKFCPSCRADIDSFSVKKNENSVVEATKEDIKIEDKESKNKKSERNIAYPKWFYGVIIVAIIIILLAAVSMFSAFSAGMNENIHRSPNITPSPTIITTAQMVVTPTPTGIAQTLVTHTPESTLPTVEPTYSPVESSTTNIQMIGNVYGLSSDPASGIDEIRFTIGLAPSAPTIDLTKMKIIFSTPTTSPMILIQESTSSNTFFTTKLNGVNPVSSMNANDQVEIDFKTAFIPANTKMTITLRPFVGAALPFSKTAPATISKINVLY